MNKKPENLLIQFFMRNGYIRQRNPEREKQLGQRYKKGYEVRLVAETQSELKVIRQLVRRAGFKLSKPFHKKNQIVQPIYGKQAMTKFLLWEKELQENI